MSDNTNSDGERRRPLKEHVVREGSGASIKVGTTTKRELDLVAAWKRRLRGAGQEATT